MTAEQARKILEIRTQSEVCPELTPDEISLLLNLSRRADNSGRGVSDADWTPTYDLTWAAMEGWSWKAAKAAHQHSFSTRGQRFEAKTVFDHCQEQMKYWRSKLTGSPSIGVQTIEVTQ